MERSYHHQIADVGRRVSRCWRDEEMRICQSTPFLQSHDKPGRVDDTKADSPHGTFRGLADTLVADDELTFVSHRQCLLWGCGLARRSLKMSLAILSAVVALEISHQRIDVEIFFLEVIVNHSCTSYTQLPATFRQPEQGYIFSCN